VFLIFIVNSFVSTGVISVTKSLSQIMTRSSVRIDPARRFAAAKEALRRRDPFDSITTAGFGSVFG